jgi:hypothetical protein
MSKQSAVKSYENRRPPTFVELLADAYPASDSRVVDKMIEGSIKLEDPVPLYHGDPISRAISCNYGSPANDEEIAEQLSQQEKELDKVFDVDYGNDRHAAKFIISFTDASASVDDKVAVRKKVKRSGQPMFSCVQYAHFENGNVCMGSEVKLSGHLCKEPEYLDWLRNPDYNREMLYLSHDNYHRPTEGEIYSFYWKTKTTDEDRNVYWLAKNERISPTRYPLFVGDTSDVYKHRLALARHRYSNGLISKEHFDEIQYPLMKIIDKRAVRRVKGMGFTNQSKGDGFIVLSKPYGDWTREEKVGMVRPLKGISYSKISRDDFVGLGLCNSWNYDWRCVDIYNTTPMNEVEYENITRTTASSVDVHLCAEKIANFVGPREPNFIVESSARAYTAKRHQHYREAKRYMPTELNLGDAYLDQSSGGIYIPNFESSCVESVIRQVRRG